MSKITFRADDDLVRQLEECDASKSEVMRDALRAHLGETGSNGTSPSGQTSASETLDDALAERVDRLVADRLETAPARQPAREVNVNISVDGSGETTEQTESKSVTDAAQETASDEPQKACKQCGNELSPSDVYCANCGEKASHRVFCDCGDELNPDWGFCPSCGRRTPAADVLGDT